MNWIKKHKISIAITTVALALLIGLGAYSYNRASAYELRVENQYRRAFYDLCDAVKNIDVALSKGIVTTEPKHMAHIANEIAHYAAYAKACLGQLPVGEVTLDNTQKFLSQVSDYTRMMASNAIDEIPVTPEQHETMMTLSGYADTLFRSLDGLEAQLLNNHFSDLVALQAQQAGEKEASYNAFSQIETGFLNYPSLIYDGPFSDHMENATPEMLKDKPQVSLEEATEKARAFIGADRLVSIEHTSDGDGNIPTYGFTATTKEENRIILIDVTKQGGYVISLLDTKETAAAELSYEEGVEICQNFLRARGFEDMKDSYYEIADGVMTINFAATQEGIILYPDLIKLKIAADTKEIIGFEAKGYLTHHKLRQDLSPQLSRAEAQKNLNPHLQADKVNLCLIPMENGTEVLCYEIKGQFEDKNYLIYVNANTGREEKILLVLDRENSLLTM